MAFRSRRIRASAWTPLGVDTVVQECQERVPGGLAWRMTTTICSRETHGQATMPIQTNRGLVAPDYPPASDLLQCESSSTEVLLKMATNESVKATIVKGIAAELTQQGLQLKKGILLKELGPDFSGYIGLNFSTHRSDGLIGLNPIMNIVCRQIEDALI